MYVSKLKIVILFFTNNIYYIFPQVHFFVKCELPSKENGTELMDIAKKLEQIEISLPEFVTAYEDDGNDGNV